MKKKDWRPRKILLVPTDEKLTDASGLGTMVEAFDGSSLAGDFVRCLPKRDRSRSHGSYRLGLIQISSFLYGHDSLDDLEEFREDPALEAIMKGETAAPRTMGDFLRDFEEDHIRKFNGYLAQMSARVRRQMGEVLERDYRPAIAPHLSIDSTPHVQSAQKMEGVAWNYDGKWCLDSQVVFDELGFAYGLQLRPGNTKSGVDAGILIENAFSPWKRDEEKYLSGDAAYCNREVIEKCLNLGAHFTLTANQATTGWENHLDEITNWQGWEYSTSQKQKAEQSHRSLPPIEVGSFSWAPGWADNIRIQVVVKRTWVEEESLFGEGKWDYYGIVAGMPMQKFSLQQVVEHHNKRGNAENFIREEKYGYDLKHFPCLKLRANHAYGLLALVAHNILRWCAILEKPHRPHFSKKLRQRFIYIPGKVIAHARQLCIKIPQRFYKEVIRLREAWQLQPRPATAMGPKVAPS
jgi:Transposase DDE domain group 1